MHKTVDIPKGCGTQIALIDQYDLFLGTLIHCPYLEKVRTICPICFLGIDPTLHFDIPMACHVDEVHCYPYKTISVLEHVVLLAIFCHAGLAVHHSRAVTNDSYRISIAEADAAGCGVKSEKSELILTARAARIADRIRSDSLSQLMIDHMQGVDVYWYGRNVDDRAFLEAGVPNYHRRHTADIGFEPMCSNTLVRRELQQPFTRAKKNWTRYTVAGHSCNAVRIG